MKGAAVTFNFAGKTPSLKLWFGNQYSLKLEPYAGSYSNQSLLCSPISLFQSAYKHPVTNSKRAYNPKAAATICRFGSYQKEICTISSAFICGHKSSNGNSCRNGATSGVASSNVGSARDFYWTSWGQQYNNTTSFSEMHSSIFEMQRGLLQTASTFLQSVLGYLLLQRGWTSNPKLSQGDKHIEEKKCLLYSLGLNTAIEEGNPVALLTLSVPPRTLYCSCTLSRFSAHHCSASFSLKRFRLQIWVAKVGKCMQQKNLHNSQK